MASKTSLPVMFSFPARSASASFAAPIGCKTNTYVYQEGGYRPVDSVKVGLPLNIILWIVATVFIPILWPLT